MKFKPDFDGAAMHLERAAVCYKNADNLQVNSKKKVATWETFTNWISYSYHPRFPWSIVLIRKGSGD